MTTVNPENMNVSILVEVDGTVHLVLMEKDKYEAIDFLVKRSVHRLIRTPKTQKELRDFLGVKE